MRTRTRDQMGGADDPSNAQHDEEEVAETLVAAALRRGHEPDEDRDADSRVKDERQHAP